MSKNPQVEEAKRWILEQRIYERYSNMLYVFPFLSDGSDPGALGAAAIDKARKEDTEERDHWRTQTIPLETDGASLEVFVSQTDARDLAQYGCVVLRRRGAGIEAVVSTLSLRLRDSFGIMPAMYGGRQPTRSVVDTLNRVSRDITEQRRQEGEIADVPVEGWRLLGVSPERVNEILRAEDLRKSRYRRDARLLKLWEQEGLCHSCQSRVEIGNVTHDHFIPRSAGGKNNWDNMVIMHPSCNREKGSKLPPGLSPDDPRWSHRRSVGGIWYPD